MASSSSSILTLHDALAEVLPAGADFTFYHISTPPTKCDAIFAALPQCKPDRTYCESHLLNVSVALKSEGKSTEQIVLAIEIQIYTTRRLTTIFVSKADSTGFLSLAGLPRSRSSPLKVISQTFVRYLATHRQRPGRRLVISLFARAQDQYLFPGSVDNGLKHVLDDRGLVKWWCRVLDPVLEQYAPQTEPTVEELENGAEMDTDKATAHGYLVVPGLEKYDTVRIFPSRSMRWTHGDPLREIAANPNAPPRCLIPHFPDDPKARYLDELDNELSERNSQTLTTPTRSDGQWRSIKTLEQFWEFMSFRQECSSGRLVGFIWVVITPPDLSADEDDPSKADSQTSLFSMAESSPPRKPFKSLKNTYSPARARRNKTNIKRLTGPIVPRLPRIKSASSASSSSSSQPETTPFYHWPPAGRGEFVLGAKDYQRALDILLHQNFTTKDTAARSTQKWTEEVGLLGGRSRASWGWKVQGKVLPESAPAGTDGAVNGVNTLDVRKKRKADEGEEKDAEAMVLGESLVRKKPKGGVESQTESADAGVNVLSAGLVRKKPKS